MNELTIIVPAPCEWISSNKRYGHWAVKATLTKAWKLAGYEAALHPLMAGHDGFAGQVQITATIHRNHNRGRMDPTNYADTAKACVDGLVSAGVLVDDSSRYVIGPDMRLGEPWERAALVLTITPSPDVAGESFKPGRGATQTTKRYPNATRVVRGPQGPKSATKEKRP